MILKEIQANSAQIDNLNHQMNKETSAKCCELLEMKMMYKLRSTRTMICKSKRLTIISLLSEIIVWRNIEEIYHGQRTKIRSIGHNHPSNTSTTLALNPVNTRAQPTKSLTLSCLTSATKLCPYLIKSMAPVGIGSIAPNMPNSLQKNSMRTIAPLWAMTQISVNTTERT